MHGNTVSEWSQEMDNTQNWSNELTPINNKNNMRSRIAACKNRISTNIKKILSSTNEDDMIESEEEILFVSLNKPIIQEENSITPEMQIWLWKYMANSSPRTYLDGEGDDELYR